MAELKTSVVDITPKLAAKWLKCNLKNRPLSPALIDQYARQIAQGDWSMTGEAIKFNHDGTLLDGQHRLRAIIKAGKAIKTLVVRGVPQEAFDRLDTGKVRDLRDVASLQGITNDFGFASAMKWVYRLTVDPPLKLRFKPSNHEVLDFYKKLKGFENSLKFGKLTHSMLRSVAVGVALHYIFRQKEVDLADQFFLSLAEGTGLEKEAPVYHLRERLIKNAASKARLPKRDIIASTIKAWNLMRAGKTAAPRQSIAWAARGPAAEYFPTIK